MANKLIHASSPYLLQHAQNPVDWFPWGKEALEKAQKENKLLIVSIGYSACHWCHVMEHESFEDESVAALMNEHFVSIKVDREERPDIDQFYMTAVQLMNQQGGWPLNCIALPDGRPVWGGTYFPKAQWTEALTALSDFYHKKPGETREYAANLEQGIRQASLFEPDSEAAPVSHSDLGTIINRFRQILDPVHGGNRGAPKFPLPVNLRFLMQYGVLTKDQPVLDHVDRTLTHMARGGIYDQIGGGFARYTVDKAWKVPHFEKMLYDNAQLLSLYSDAFKYTKNKRYREVVEQTIAFLERELMSPDGIFYSALDADSDGEEGKYYIWKEDELRDLLGEDFNAFADYYNINETGYWENGNYILQVTEESQQVPGKHGWSDSAFQQKLRQWQETLLQARAERTPPGLDNKSLTSWNALMITALCTASEALENPAYLDMAIRTATFFRDKMMDDNGRLYRVYNNGKRSVHGFHDDYALFIEAAIHLYESTFDLSWLQFAESLTHTAHELFFNPAAGMYNLVSDEHLETASNSIDTRDGVIPSSNAVMTLSLQKLGHLLSVDSMIRQAEEMTAHMAKRLTEYPAAFSLWGTIALNRLFPFYEVVVTGTTFRGMAGELKKTYLPNHVMAGSENHEMLDLLKNRVGKETRIFVCENKQCNLPVTTVQEALELLTFQPQ